MSHQTALNNVPPEWYYDWPLERTLNNLLVPFSRGLNRAAFKFPAVDISYDKENVLYVYELPGLNKDDIKVAIENGRVTVSGERKQKYIQYDRVEISHGNFSRTISLPRGVDASGVTARYNNGLLTLKFPKSHGESKANVVTVTGEE